MQVGDGNFQANYTYNLLTWTDGVALPPLAGTSGVVASPYRGLGAYGERDAAFFFGREDAAEQVLGRMSRLSDGRGILMMSGASGAGKSSLVRAGVLPRLRGAGLAGAPGAARWPCVVFTPGRAPLDELAVRVAPLARADAAVVRRGLAADPGGFALTARQAVLAQSAGLAAGPGDDAVALWPEGERQPGGEPRLLLVVDQFEQVFTLCGDAGERQAFITALCAAASPGRDSGSVPAALVVLLVRADFEGRCAAYPELAEVVQDRYLLSAMTGRQLRMAITGPARVAGAAVNNELAEVLLAEVRARQPGEAGAGVLPLLSHALDQAWRSRTGEVLTLADYERTGGIEKAVAASAERAYGGLTPGQREAARQVFIRLAAASTGGADTTAPATRAELADGKTPAQAADVEAVLEAFAAERLLTLAADSVEISHEALLTAWPLLRDTWLAKTHADRATRTRLRVTAADWERRSRDPAYLYRGTLLQAATEAARQVAADPARHPPLGLAERDFLRASSRARRRAARWRQAAIAGLTALTLAATAIAIAAANNAGTASRNAEIAVRDAARADRQHAIALSRLLAADSLSTVPAVDPRTARQLAVAAWSVYPTSQAGSAMTTLLVQRQQEGTLFVADDAVNAVAFSPDGKLLATADNDGKARLWDPATGQPVGKPLPAATDANGGLVTGVAFSPDGKLLATEENDGKVRLWDPATGRPVGNLLPGGVVGGIPTGLAFSPDGKLLAVADDAGTVRLWDPATGRPAGNPLPADGAGGVSGLAFSPDGKLLATADGVGTVRLWDPATGRPAWSSLPVSAGRADGVSVAFGPDGKLLATAGGDGIVRLWDPATGRPAGNPLPSGTSDGNGVNVAFSPDGKLLATADDDGRVRLWDPVTGRPTWSSLPVDANHILVARVVFSPDGKLLASVDGHGIVRLWDLATGRPTASTAIDGVSVAFSPDGKLLAVADGRGRVRLSDPATGRPVGSLLPTELPADAGPFFREYGLAFSPDGKLLAAAEGDGTVQLWDTSTRRPAGSTLPADTTHYSVISVAFSPDGKLLATADEGDTVQLWNLATRQPVGSPLPGGAAGVAFSPDGKLLAAATPTAPCSYGECPYSRILTGRSAPT